MATAHDDQDPAVKEIEVLLISAQDLKNVKHFTKLRTYAVVYVERDFHMEKTHVDEEGGTNPKWNEVLKVKFHDKLLEEDVTASLNIDIYAHGHVREKIVGSARVLLSDVLKDVHDEKSSIMEKAEDSARCVILRVWRASGKPQGFLSLWVPPTGKVSARTESSVCSVGDDVEVEEVVVAAEEKRGEVWNEKMEDKLGAPIVMLDSHAHSVLDLAVLGPSFDRSSSV